MEKNRILSDEEWGEVKRDGEGCGEAVEEEEKCMVESAMSINERVKGKQLLGDGRLSVVFCDESVDFSKVLEWGVKNGNGSEEAREALRVRLEDMVRLMRRGRRRI